MTLGPDFVKDSPPKSSSSFVEDKPSQSGTFKEDKPPADNHVFSGDNTSGDAYAEDFTTFGEIYGQDNYGGLVHFATRPTPPVISH